MEFHAEKNERLDKFLAAHYASVSRSRFQQLIKNGAVKVNDRPSIKPSLRIKLGDRIIINEEKLSNARKDFAIEPEPNIPLNIAYEDKDILVIDKPAGLLVHPTPSQRQHTLVNALIALYPNIISVGENPLRPGIVHRLDKDTSGLIIIAKNQNAFLAMKRQFLKKTIIKKYLALVEGVPRDKEGVIKYDIRPSKKNRLKKVAIKKTFDKFRTKRSTRAATTVYKVREIIANQFALVEAQPLTGRTHQIRVHMAAIGTPIAGDRLYGSKTKIPRQFLHAYYLKFITPSGKPITLETKLPEDLKEVLIKIKK